MLMSGTSKDAVTKNVLSRSLINLCIIAMNLAYFGENIL